MGLFRRRDGRVDEVMAQVAELDRRLAVAHEDNAALFARLRAIESKPLPAPAPAPVIDTDDLAARVRTLLGDAPPAIDASRLTRLEAAHDQLHQRVTELTGVLTNQLHELNGELDTTEHAVALRIRQIEGRLDELGTMAVDPSMVSIEQLCELRANQVRIANELARFSIAVREEMAALSPRVASASGQR